LSDPAAIIAARLAVLWQTSRPSILERIAALHAAHDALVRDPADTDARSKGREAAHKLSGVLGVFGLPQGSELSFNMESLLMNGNPLSFEDVIWLGEQIEALDAVIAAKG
jgi:HPt (histidine-containing phosphotransfer) domain-containing protein